MRFEALLAGIALAGATAAQFIFPNSSSSLQLNQAVQLQWSRTGLQAPISINLVPAGNGIRDDIVLKQVAVNIGNVGVLQWTADETITVFPKFAMIITDTRGQVIVSQPFAIQSLTRQPTPQQQADLKKGKAGSKNGSNQNGQKTEKSKNSNDDKKNNNANKNGNKEADKQTNKDAAKGGKTEGGKGSEQKEKVAEKQGDSKDSQDSKGGLLPLPGLPASDAKPVSLKPLPNAAEVPASTPAAAPTPSAAKPSSSTAAPAAGEEASPSPTPSAPAAPEAAPAAPEAAPAAPEAAPTASEATATATPEPEAAKAPEAAEAEAAPGGFTTVQPAAAEATPEAVAAAAAAAAAPEVVDAAAVEDEEDEDGFEIAAAAAVSRTSSGEAEVTQMPRLMSILAAEDQETITTVITPRPVTAAETSSETASRTTSAASTGKTAPTPQSGKSSAQRSVPSLALGLLAAAAAAGLALL
ncbi:hypothetical protein V2A60_000849 [Cordyceps javanica]